MRYEDLQTGDTLPAWSVLAAPAWQAGFKTAGQLVYDAGTVYRVKVDMASSNAAPRTYNSSAFFESLTDRKAFVTSSFSGGVLTLLRADGTSESYALSSNSGGSAEPIKDIYATDATLRNAVVALSYTNFQAKSAPNGSFPGQRFVHESTGIIYECLPIPGAETVVGWVKKR